MLTPKQKIVSLINGECSYVVALPGAGKTYVNTILVENLLNSSPNLTILDATFTRNAAAEMKERLAEKLSPESLSRVKVSTLDSCIVNMAKAFFSHHNKKFKLIMGGSYYLTVMRVVNELNVCDLDTALEILDYYLSFPHEIDFEQEYHQQVVSFYKEVLASKPVPTFDLKLLGKFLIDRIKSGDIVPYSFDVIIIDEFQDTGQIQYEWIKQHSVSHKGKSVVIGIGDDDQSLYRFAGSLGHANFINLKKDLSAKGYSLDTCFRCAPKILNFGASIIKSNRFRVAKEFNSNRTDLNGTINVYNHSDVIDELLPFFIKKPNNTAILCRTNMKVNDVEILLLNEEIPYQRLNGRGGLFNDYNVLAYLKLLIVIILDVHVEMIIDVLSWLKESEYNLRYLESLIRDNNIRRFSQINTTELLELDFCTATNIILNNASRWRGYGKNTDIYYCQKNIVVALVDYFPEKRSSKRVFSAADFITQRIKGDTLKDRVLKINRMMNTSNNTEVKIDREKVTIGTLHSSKGLEWKSVWLIDWSEGSFPTEMKDSAIAAKNDHEMHIEDERRLAYVGITRAEEELNITFSEKIGLFLANSDLSLTNFYDGNGELVINQSSETHQEP
ncbi:UvrD-helicase domain-containing protein [Pseudoalteromonas prydzensis]|uniref:UvrD-helicase domain-containing protein n=1 Tax=Pseudoalteromonas prydzensis TaxID=182141 RepID=UPI003FD29A8A